MQKTIWADLGNAILLDLVGGEEPKLRKHHVPTYFHLQAIQSNPSSEGYLCGIERSRKPMVLKLLLPSNLKSSILHGTHSGYNM